MTRVLVTGGTGFVGRALCPTLLEAGYEVSVATRNPRAAEDMHHVEVRPIPAIGAGTDWTAALRDVDLVVHLAARVHVMDEPTADPLAAYRQVNTDGTRRLAEDAAAAGVRRFVLLSTVKVLGEATSDGPFRDDDAPAPQDPYGWSKLEAEQVLAEVAAGSDMETVVLRPPLVYGPHVKGNFLALLSLCRRAPPLPLGGVGNRRTMVYVDNLVDAILRGLDHPRAAGRTYLVGADEAVSTPDLIRALAAAMKRPARLFAVPPSALRLAGRALGRSAAAARLLESLVVDDARIRAELDWRPRIPLLEGLNKTADWFMTRARI